jgi:hypothetical protein
LEENQNNELTQKTLAELFLWYLKDVSGAENQILKALPKMPKRANTPDLKKAFETQFKETENPRAKTSSANIHAHAHPVPPAPHEKLHRLRFYQRSLKPLKVGNVQGLKFFKQNKQFCATRCQLRIPPALKFGNKLALATDTKRTGYDVALSLLQLLLQHGCEHALGPLG